MKTFLVVLAAFSLSLNFTIAAHQPVPEPSPNPGGDPSSLARACIEGSLRDPGRQGASTLQQLTAHWTPAAREAARQMMDRYGGPQEATANRLIWHDNRPWKTTEVVNDGVVHNFPVPHHDVLIQTLAIDVP